MALPPIERRLHKDLKVNHGIHAPHSFEVADPAGIALLNLVPEDRWKLVLDLSTELHYVITSVTPITARPLGADPADFELPFMLKAVTGNSSQDGMTQKAITDLFASISPAGLPDLTGKVGKVLGVQCVADVEVAAWVDPSGTPGGSTTLLPTTGTSETEGMTQKAITEALVATTGVVLKQESGQSEIEGMSQKAITDLFYSGVGFSLPPLLGNTDKVLGVIETLDPLGVPELSTGWVEKGTTLADTPSLDAVFDVTKDGTGFANRNAVVTFTGGAAPSVSIKPEAGLAWSFFYRGRKVEVTGELSYALDSATEFDTGFYLSLNQQGEFVNTGRLPDFDNTALALYVHYSSVNQDFIVEGEERHSSARDMLWHKSKHIEDGMVIRKLGTLQWTADDAVQVGIQLTTTVVADEDMTHIIEHSVTGAEPFKQVLEGSKAAVQIPTLVVGADSKLQYTDSLQVPWSISALTFNDTGTGTLVEATDGKFVNYFLTASHCRKFPVKLIMGRGEYDSLADAEGETLESLGLNFPEIAMLYRLTLVKDDAAGTVGKCKIMSVRKACSKLIFESSEAQAGTSLSSHHDLLDRNALNAHSMEAITGLVDKLEELRSSIVVAQSGSGMFDKSMFGGI